MKYKKKGRGKGGKRIEQLYASVEAKFAAHLNRQFPISFGTYKRHI